MESVPYELWEIDIKFIPTIEEGNVALLDIIDVYSKEIVGSYIGKSCTSKDVVRLISEAILYSTLTAKGRKKGEKARKEA